MAMIPQAIRNRPWTALFATGVVTSSIYSRWKEEQRCIADRKKKKVLVLPFYRMRVVEQKSPTTSLSSLLRRTGGGGNPAIASAGSDKVIEIQADELVSLIHEAAQDPSIVSLYGEFGNGGSISTGGWAHLEEIRNAIQVFAASHRVHKEPGMEDTPHHQPKSLYAYANTFANPMGSVQSMQDFFLASAFSQIHLQQQGDLNLFGLHSTNTFFRDFLHKYGIGVTVWRHGEYKNMANAFSHTHYTKEHRENVAGILVPIHNYVLDAIYTSRHQQLQKYSDLNKFWSMVENAGSLPARVAHQIGFVDYLPRLNPLEALIKNNKQSKEDARKKESDSKEEKEARDEKATDSLANKSSNDGLSDPKSDDDPEQASKFADSLAAKWRSETDLDQFHGDAKISIEGYAQQKALERLQDAKQWKTFQALQSMSESNPVARGILTVLGYGAPYFNISKDKYSEAKANGLKLKEKIAVVKINGAIGEAAARKAERALCKIKEQKDIKCVVLRVDSPGGSVTACETIYQQLQDLPQKVVVSFGNVSASGGYYISANAARIFALPTTITGSIGVVVLRMDLRALAKQYGVTFDSIPTSSMSGSFDPFYPITAQMSENFGNGADRAYYHFKSLVSDGRDMDMQAVEELAQGKVFVGEKAQDIGLVDELGGLDRAIAYAQRNFTSSGHAQVVHWPPKKSLWEYLLESSNDDDTEFDEVDIPNVRILQMAFESLLGTSLLSLPWPSGGARQCNMADISSGTGATVSFPMATSGVMLTTDENTAIRLLLEGTGIEHRFNLLSAIEKRL